MRVLLLVLSLVSAAASAQSSAASTLATPTADTTAAGGAPSLADASGRSVQSVLTLSVVPIGARVAYARRPVSNASVSFPLEIEASALLVGDGDGGLGLVTGIGGAIKAAHRLGLSTMYVQPGFQLSVGQEVGYSAYDDGNRLFVGGRLGLELIRYPTRSGFVGGIGLYVTRRFGPHVYTKSDASLAIMLGAQF